MVTILQTLGEDKLGYSLAIARSRLLGIIGTDNISQLATLALAWCSIAGANLANSALGVGVVPLGHVGLAIEAQMNRHSVGWVWPFVNIATPRKKQGRDE